MRPKKNKPTTAVDLFRSRLDQIINLKHELAQLAGKIDWNWLARMQREACHIAGGIADPPPGSIELHLGSQGAGRVLDHARPMA